MSRPLIGLDMLYYAPVSADDGAATTYGTPVRLENLVSLSIQPNTDISTFFADDAPREVFSQIGEVDVSIQLPDIAGEHYAYLVGSDYNSGTGQVSYTTGATAPDVAIGFRAQKSDGTYRYLWLMKGKFGIPPMEHQTKEGSVNFQTMTLSGKFVARLSDNMVFRRIDENDPNFVFPGLPSTWFDDPNLGVIASPDALTVASVGVVADTVTWTFADGASSGHVSLSSVTEDNFKIYDLAGEQYVTAGLTLGRDATNHNQVVLEATGLTASTDHIAIVMAGVKSTVGGVLVDAYYEPFTTA